MAGAEQGQGAADRAHRGALAGGVAVEAQHRHLDQPPQQFELAFGQGGAHRRDRLADAGGRERDNVHVAFDHHDPPGLARDRAGAVQIVQRAPFVEQRRVRRIQVLGCICFRRLENTPAKSDRPPARVLDRQHQPPAETGVGFLALDVDQQAGFDQQPGVEALERLADQLAPFGGVAEPEPLDRVRIEPALLQIFARFLAFAIQQVEFEPFLG